MASFAEAGTVNCDSIVPRLKLEFVSGSRISSKVNGNAAIMNSPDSQILRKVLVLYVGGTIGMTRNQSGVLSPKANIFHEKLKQISQLYDGNYVESVMKPSQKERLALPLFEDKYRIIYDIKEFDPLLDSSNMGAKDWKKIALYIENRYSYYDGFVVVHGTDTLVYTASALSFMFENLDKPIIITGSQLPIHDSRSDGVSNLQHSLIFSGAYCIPEVCVFFGKALMRGNRTVKISSDSFDAFESPNLDSLATVGSEINLKFPLYQKCSNRVCELHASLNTNVTVLTIYPEINEKMVRHAFEPPAEGVILLTYGSGNIPLIKDYLTSAIKEATDRGVLVVNRTQCLKGSVKSIYETNKVLVDCGVVSSYDMTMEATYTKLLYVLSLTNLTYNEKKTMMESNMRGELKS